MMRMLLLLPLVLVACNSPEYTLPSTTVDASNQLDLFAGGISRTQDSAVMVFTKNSVELNEAESGTLAFLKAGGVQRVQVQTPAQDSLLEPRTLSLIRMVRAFGVESTRISRMPLESLPANEYRIEAERAVVISPNCPNWSQSATSNFQNKPFSQMGCATVTNMGHMVEDPTHFQRGTAGAAPDATRNAAVIGAYKSGGAAGGASADAAAAGGAESEAQPSSAPAPAQ